MKNKFLYLLTALFITISSFGQVTTKVQTDSMRIFQVGGHPAELIIENSTKGNTGAFLQNIGNGRTKFNYALDTVYLQGDSVITFRRGNTLYSFHFPSGSVNAAQLDSIIATHHFITADSMSRFGFQVLAPLKVDSGLNGAPDTVLIDPSAISGVVKTKFSVTKSSDSSIQLHRDTSFTGNVSNWVYGVQGSDDPHWYKNVPDTPSLAGQLRLSHFASVAALKASSYYLYGFKMAFVQSYWGDGDKLASSEWFYSDTSTKTPNDMDCIRPSMILSGPGRWLYVPKWGSYNLRAMGAKSDNFTSISQLANYALSNEPVGSIIYLPQGAYKADTTIDVPPGMKFIGDNQKTYIYYGADRVGIHILKNNGNGNQSVSGFYLTASARDAADNSTNPPSRLYHAFFIENVCYLTNCYAFDFSGAAYFFRGSLSGYGSNVSAAYAENIGAKQCGNGIVIWGADANGISIHNPDIRDMYGYGFWDESSFGMATFGGEFHNNALGHYAQISLSAISSFDGTYFEGGVPDATTVNGYLTVKGGNQGTGFGGTNTMVIIGNRVSSIYAATGGGTYHKIGLTHLADGRAAFSMQTNPDQDGVYLANYPLVRNTLYGNSWRFFYYGDTTAMMDFSGFDVRRTTGGELMGVRTPFAGFGRYWGMGSKTWQYASDTAMSGLVGNPYLVGAIVWNKNYTSGGTIFWICTTRGSISQNHDLNPGKNATDPYGTDTLTLDTYSDRIQEGDYIKVNGDSAIVLEKLSSGTKLRVSHSFAAFSTNQPVTYIAPKWLAISGTGGSGAATWGSITGTLSSQSDLQTALNAKQPNLQYQDEGSNIGTSGAATAINFTGAGVTSSFSGGVITVNIPGGAGTPSLTSTQIAFGDGSNAMTSSSNLTYNATEKQVTSGSLKSTGGTTAFPGGFNSNYYAYSPSPAIYLQSSIDSTGIMYDYSSSTDGGSGGITYVTAGGSRQAILKASYNGGSTFVQLGTYNYFGSLYSSLSTLLGYNVKPYNGSSDAIQRYNPGDNGSLITVNNSGIFFGVAKAITAGASASSYADLKITNTGHLNFITAPAAYSSGGYDVLVRNQSSKDVESITINANSGTYTPTPSGQSNITSGTITQANYTRTGNVVTVSFNYSVTVTAANSTAQVSFSLPVASDFTSGNEVNGVFTTQGEASGYVTTDTANDVAKLLLKSTTTSSVSGTVTFSYKVQ